MAMQDMEKALLTGSNLLQLAKTQNDYEFKKLTECVGGILPSETSPAEIDDEVDEPMKKESNNKVER